MRPQPSPPRDPTRRAPEMRQRPPVSHGGGIQRADRLLRSAPKPRFLDKGREKDGWGELSPVCSNFLPTGTPPGLGGGRAGDLRAVRCAGDHTFRSLAAYRKLTGLRHGIYYPMTSAACQHRHVVR